MGIQLFGGRPGGKRGLYLAGAAVFAAIVSATGAAHCQSPLKPSDFDLAYTVGSPTAEALGGAYLLSMKGPEAGAANPSRVNYDRKSEVTLSAVASTSNIDVNKTEALINQLNDLNNSAKDDEAAAENTFNDVYNYAVGAGAGSGHPATLAVRLDPVIGASLGGRWAIVAESSIQSVDKLYVGTDGSNYRTVSVSGGAIAISSVGVPFAAPVDGVTIGLTPKYIRADYIGYGLSNLSDDPMVNSTSSSTPYANKGTFDLDAGATAPVVPGMVTGSVVVRHLLMPDLPMDGYSLRLNPEADLGFLATYMGFNGYAELHNISGANGGGITDHLGVERWFGSLLALRAGLDDGKFVYGAGLGLAGFKLDLALGANASQRAGLSLDYSI